MFHWFRKRPRGKNVVSLTPAAVAQLQRLQSGERKMMLRCAVEFDGRSAFEYRLSLETQPRADDIRDDSYPVTVLVDRGSEVYLSGATIDWLAEAGQSGFAITNPNAERHND